MRREDWPVRLDQAIRESRGREFRYGRWDCCIFANHVVCAMTGEDRLKRWKYRGKKRAMRLLSEHGGLEGAVTAEMGEPISVRYCQRGDLVMVEDDGGSLGVCVGADVFYPARPRGLARAKLTDGLMGWRV